MPTLHKLRPGRPAWLPPRNPLAEQAALPVEPCSTCGGAGRVRIARRLDDPDFGRAEPCPACVAAEPITLTLRRMAIPAQFAAACLDTWLPAPPAALVDYVASWPPSAPFALLTGNRGSGKTHLACGILREAFERHGVRGTFWAAPDLADEYRRASRGEPGDEDLVDARCLRVPLLVLDDWGAERSTALAAERIYRLIDVRYRERLPTVVTTNVAASALDPRATSRLMSGIVVAFTGTDWRLKA